MTPERSTEELSASMDRFFDTAMRVKDERDELLAALRRYVEDYDPECPPEDMPDAGCIECTVGTVPNNLNTGLCKYHQAVAALASTKGTAP